MDIEMLASDSLGVRSMATLVKGIVIDPSAALGPRRYGLRPSEIENLALELARKKISSFVRKAKKVIVTHYHWDHVPHPELDYSIFSDKEIYLKDFESMHRSGKIRGKRVFKKINEFTDLIEIVDGKEFDDFLVSPPFWHGRENSKVGKIVMVLVKDFLFGSDTQGVLDENAKEWIIEVQPKIFYFSGFPTYLERIYTEEEFKVSLGNIEEIIVNTDLKKLIIDHHAVRDMNFFEKFKELFDFGEEFGVKVMTAAEFMGFENLFLEAWRKDIYEGKLDTEPLKEKLKRIYS